MKRKIIFILSIFLIFILIIFLVQNNYKKINIGNNITNKTTNQVVSTILNIESYSANTSINVKSNKNENNYRIKQEHIKNKKYIQEVIEPYNIKGTVISYDSEVLKIENTNLGLSNIYENYPYIVENELDLISFIDDYKNDKDAQMIENETSIILKTKNRSGNKYNSNKILTIDKKSQKPTKLEIKDVTQNTLIYILYNEIKFNNI